MFESKGHGTTAKLGTDEFSTAHPNERVLGDLVEAALNAAQAAMHAALQKQQKSFDVL